MSDYPLRSPQEATDSFFMSSFKAGNKDTYKWLVESIARPLLNFGYTSISSSKIVHEIAAAAFIKLFYTREGMTSIEHIKKWLFIIVRNAMTDEIRAGRVALQDADFDLDDGGENSAILMVLQSQFIDLMAEKIDAFSEDGRLE